jgi:hypothetical protein
MPKEETHDQSKGHEKKLSNQPQGSLVDNWMKNGEETVISHTSMHVLTILKNGLSRMGITFVSSSVSSTMTSIKDEEVMDPH